MSYLIYAILLLGFLNLFRLTFFMVSSDIYDVASSLRNRKKNEIKPYRPWVSVIIPAHNEEVCIVRTIKSVLDNDYSRKRIIIVDDGSTDDTAKVVRSFIGSYARSYRRAVSKTVRTENGIKRVWSHSDLPAKCQIKLVRQSNSGKAAAINNAIKNHAWGSLIMVLDGDSILDSEAISNSVVRFQDKDVVAAAANVKIIDNNLVLNAAQRVEYVISHRIKRALTTLNMEYIIGGVGSTFRKKIIQQVKYYDSDTLTEDIDLTLKIILRKGNKSRRVIFASDVIAYTEGVMKFKSLIRQRFRWKYGRTQSFFKNRQIFFSRQSIHSKQLAWLYLPYIVFTELLLLAEPFITGLVLYFSFKYGGASGFLRIYLIITVFSLINIIAENTESLSRKIKLFTLVPIAYPLLMIMSLVDFIVLIQTLVKLPSIMRGNSKGGRWEHVERSGAAAALIS